MTLRCGWAALCNRLPTFEIASQRAQKARDRLAAIGPELVACGRKNIYHSPGKISVGFRLAIICARNDKYSDDSQSATAIGAATGASTGSTARFMLCGALGPIAAIAGGIAMGYYFEAADSGSALALFEAQKPKIRATLR